MSNAPFAALASGILLLLSGCSDEEKRAEPSRPGLYADYRVLAEEGKEAVTIRAQFRRGGPEGPTEALQPPASIALDGAPLPGDSVGKAGTFYEVQQRLDEFRGTHRFDFRREEGSVHSTEFQFTPFTLTPLPTSLSRGNLVFQLSGLEEGTPVHIILTDTSFSSNDLNAIDTVRDGKLIVTEDRLQNLSNGPVQLQLIREGQERLEKVEGLSGKLTYSYSLQREFQLEDRP